MGSEGEILTVGHSNHEEGEFLELVRGAGIQLIAGSARPIPQEQAVARERLWTPEKEKAEGGEGGLWTPGDG